MNCDYLLIHYGELSTKGNNRREFISILTRNVKMALSGLSVEVNGRRDHIYVKVNGQKEGEEAVSRLLCVPGIIKISPGYECGKDVEELSEFGAKLILDSGKKTFKVEAKLDVFRGSHSFFVESVDGCKAEKTDYRSNQYQAQYSSALFHFLHSFFLILRPPERLLS